MTGIGQPPFNLADAQHLILAGLGHAEQGRWRSASQCLESAIVAAPPQIVAQLLDTLVMYYVAGDMYPPLFHTILIGGDFSPNAAIGGLLLERNRRYGLTVPDFPAGFFGEALGALRGHLAQGTYSGHALSIIVSLAVQVDELDLALDGLRQIVRTDSSVISEELITGLLALCLKEARRDVAVDVVEALRHLPWSIADAANCLLRYEVLLGRRDMTAVPEECTDKVVAFLRRRSAAARGGRS